MLYDRTAELAQTFDTPASAEKESRGRFALVVVNADREEGIVSAMPEEIDLLAGSRREALEQMLIAWDAAVAATRGEIDASDGAGA